MNCKCGRKMSVTNTTGICCVCHVKLFYKKQKARKTELKNRVKKKQAKTTNPKIIPHDCNDDSKYLNTTNTFRNTTSIRARRQIALEMLEKAKQGTLWF